MDHRSVASASVEQMQLQDGCVEARVKKNKAGFIQKTEEHLVRSVEELCALLPHIQKSKKRRSSRSSAPLLRRLTSTSLPKVSPQMEKEDEAFQMMP